MTEQAYLDLLRDVMENGVDRGDRTGTGTRSVFGRQIRFDLSKGFPLLTTKKMFLKGIIAELLWFLAGDTNAKTLEDQGVNIWREWGDPETRELGPVYGKQWRQWFSGHEYHAHYWSDENKWERVPQDADELDEGELRPRYVDQITDLVNRLRIDPNSRRHLVVAWNPGELDQMALSPCHCLVQFYVRPMSVDQRWKFARSMGVEVEEYCVGGIFGPDGRIIERFSPVGGVQSAVEDWDRNGVPSAYLDCQLYQRSGDGFLGVPYNHSSYSLLTMMLAQQLGYAPGEFIHTFGDLHLYSNHFEQVREQLSREPYPFPQMVIRKAPDIFSYTIDSFELQGYQSHPTIKAPVAV